MARERVDEAGHIPQSRGVAHGYEESGREGLVVVESNVNDG